jgi:RNA polymerase primary sigma factor
VTREEELRLIEDVRKARLAQAQLSEASDRLPAERRRLLREVVEAGEKARDLLFERNRAVVDSLADKFQRPGVPLSRLLEQGNAALLSALDKFDPQKGFRFTNYARWWIRQALAEPTEPQAE